MEAKAYHKRKNLNKVIESATVKFNSKKFKSHQKFAEAVAYFLQKSAVDILGDDESPLRLYSLICALESTKQQLLKKIKPVKTRKAGFLRYFWFYVQYN